MAASRRALLGSILSQGVSFSWRDRDVAIEMGIRGKTVGDSSLHVEVAAILRKSEGNLSPAHL